MQLDGKDHRIIELLRENSRASVRDIAKLAKLRPSTVHDRIKKLVRDGVIEKFTLKLNNKAVGENFIVIMMISTEPSFELPKSFFKNKHVKEAFGITGQYDLMLKLKFKDIEEFNDYVLRFRKENRFVKETVTMVVTANIKEEM